MKNIGFVLFLIIVILYSPLEIQAASSNGSLPCSLVLNSINNNSNAKGVALVYKVKLLPSFPRTSISIHGVHLPEPSTVGNYDTYVGFAYVPHIISWKFKLYPTTEESPTWAGRFDDITLNLEKASIQVRLFDSKTDKLGPTVLTGNFELCK